MTRFTVLIGARTASTDHCFICLHKNAGLADDNPIFYPWGRAPQSSSGSVASSSSAASTASGGSAPKQKKAQMETAQAGVAGVEEVLELGRLRLRIGAPLTPALQRGFITWVIDRQECSRVEEAAVQVDVLQRLFRQVLAVREFKLWRASLRAGSEAVEGGPLDLCLAPGSLADKGTVREVVAEANLKDVIRDEGTPEEQVAMALLSHWLADAGDTLHRLQGGAAYDSEGSSDDEGDVFGSKRKRKRLSTGKASPSFHSPSRRVRRALNRIVCFASRPVILIEIDTHIHTYVHARRPA